MPTVLVQDRDDAYGPALGDGQLWGGGLVLLALLNMLVASACGAAFPGAVVAVLWAAAATVACRLVHVVARRRLRLRVLRDGRRCEAAAVGKRVGVYNGFDAAAEPFYWLTVRYAVGGAAYESRARVTDRVHRRAEVGRPIRVRVLPGRPTLWVPESPADDR